MKQIFVFLILFVLIQNLSAESILEKYISSYVNEHNFSGTILIKNNNKSTYYKSFGFANRQFSIQNTNKTRYKIASITKLFTAVLILKFYEQGKIDLGKTIKYYLPEFKGQGAENITVSQLLNHTSGIINIDTISSQESAIKNGMPIYQLPHTTDEIVSKFCTGKLLNDPGKVFSYNNAEYIILGKIIEEVSGKTYEQELQDKILFPLKMSNSGLLYQHAIIPLLADTYFMSNDLKMLVNDLPVYIENWYASGAMYSNTEDLLNFSDSFFNNKLLKKETMDLMFKPGLDKYGYSVWIDKVELNNKAYTAVKRPGSIMGANGILYHFLDTDLTIIILSNTNTTNLDNFVLDLSKKLLK